jgi:hypothetical protein
LWRVQLWFGKQFHADRIFLEFAGATAEVLLRQEAEKLALDGSLREQSTCEDSLQLLPVAIAAAPL